MNPLPRKRLHELVDELSEDQVEAAERYLRSLRNQDDPVSVSCVPLPSTTKPSAMRTAKPSRTGVAISPPAAAYRPCGEAAAAEHHPGVGEGVV